MAYLFGSYGTRGLKVTSLRLFSSVESLLDYIEELRQQSVEYIRTSHFIRDEHRQDMIDARQDLHDFISYYLYFTLYEVEPDSGQPVKRIHKKKLLEEIEKRGLGNSNHRP